MGQVSQRRGDRIRDSEPAKSYSILEGFTFTSTVQTNRKTFGMYFINNKETVEMPGHLLWRSRLNQVFVDAHVERDVDKKVWLYLKGKSSEKFEIFNWKLSSCSLLGLGMELEGFFLLLEPSEIALVALSFELGH